MSAITDLTTYKNGARWQTFTFAKANASTCNGGTWHSTWLETPDAGSTPSTAAVPDNTTAGGLLQANSSGNQFITDISFLFSSLNGSLMICDRLSHQGGLSGTAAGAQTTNLPTAALTRYTNGIGVFAAIEVYSNLGITGQTVTASYTNQAGTAGQTSIATNIGGAMRVQGQMIPLPLQVGDQGVKSVESVTLSGSTGTAGNFGITLFKPLMIVPYDEVIGRAAHRDGLIGLGGQVPEVISNACLWMLTAPQGALNSLFNVGNVIGRMRIMEGS